MPPSAPAYPATAPAAGGKKILGLPAKTVVIGSVALFAGVLGYLWWRSRQAKNTSSSASASTSASAGGYANAFSQYLEQNYSSASAGTGTGGVGGGGGGSASTGTATGTTVTVPNLVGETTAAATTKLYASNLTPSNPKGTPGTNKVTSTSPAAGTKVAPKSTVQISSDAKAPAKAKAPTMPANVHETKKTTSSVTLAWDKVTGATRYRIRVTYAQTNGQDKSVHESYATSTSVIVSGLSRNRTYTFHVAAEGPGGISPETNGPQVKTNL